MLTTAHVNQDIETILKQDKSEGATVLRPHPHSPPPPGSTVAMPLIQVNEVR